MLEQQLASWNGKSVDELKELYINFGLMDDLAAELIHFLKQPDLQNGASWLLKRYVEEGKALSRMEINNLFANLAQLEHWGGQLHVLQMLPFLTIGAADLEQVEPFIRRGLNADNKFVRAWSYNGLHLLASRFPQYRDETTLLLEQALEKEAASVKARVRKILKAGYPT